MATPASPMSTQKAFLYLFLILAGCYLLGTVGEHSGPSSFAAPQPVTNFTPPNPVTYPVTDMCQGLQLEADALVQRQNAENDAATKRDLRQFESLDRRNASERERRNVATNMDVQDELRETKQTNEYEDVLERMKNAGCLTHTAK